VPGAIVSTARDRWSYTVTATDPFDVTDTVDLADELVAMARDRRVRVTLDLGGVSSLDASGLLLVARARNAFGSRFRVTGAAPPVAAMLHTNGLASVLLRRS
jgi:anti-anti-sigma regulatory factor